MVDISIQLHALRKMIENGQYITLNRGRQYGKTTTLYMLQRLLDGNYEVLSLDFQGIGNAGFRTEESFVQSLSRILIRKQSEITIPDDILEQFREFLSRKENKADLNELFFFFFYWCMELEKPVVMFIDEVDSAANNQVFLDFLAQLRLQYLEHKKNRAYKIFQSVILAGVTDVKNLRRRIRPEEAHKLNSPWNIAVEFTHDMSFSVKGIAGMLSDYEKEHQTGMDVEKIAQEIRDYTGGYPFLVCRICQILDEDLMGEDRFDKIQEIWTVDGVQEAVRKILLEDNTLFHSLMGKLSENEELCHALKEILFGGVSILYEPDKFAVMDAKRYGFISVENGKMVIANRIFETRLYNYFLGNEEMKFHPIYRQAVQERERFVKNGHLDMEKVLEHFVICFDDLYGDTEEAFDEEEGRRRFLLYLRPIINGTGNYYIEARTRNNKRMDVVVDYLGERFVIELKIWRGNAYKERGEKQLSEYLDYFHLKKGYMLSYCFQKKKEKGVSKIFLGDKVLIEAIV